jgi:hypothetical protein
MKGKTNLEMDSLKPPLQRKDGCGGTAMDHPIAPESLERFLHGATSREENRRILAHLLVGCRSCSEHIARRRESGPGAYDTALDRFEETLLHGQAPEKLDLPPPVAELHPAAGRGRLSLSKL